MQFDPATLTGLAAVLGAASGLIVSLSKEARSWFFGAKARRRRQKAKKPHYLNHPNAQSSTRDMTPESNEETSMVPSENPAPRLGQRSKP